MSKQPTVSIIIPTYNRAHLIGETLDSVLAQTYQNWECIVVDDGSTDNTSELLAVFCQKDGRFEYYQRPKDRPAGGNAARNYGFEMSKGQYIQWFDSDDLMHADTLKIKIKYALDKKADIIIAKHSSKKDIQLTEKPKIQTFKSNTFYIDYILDKKPVITNDVMVKRSIIKEHRFDEKLYKAQEYEFFSRLFNQNIIYCFLELTLTIYRETQNSISKSTSRGNTKQVESLIYLSKKIQKEHASNPLIVGRAKRQGRKTYKNLVKQKNIYMVLKNYYFFSSVHYKSGAIFSLFMIYNFVSGRGFDAIKPKNK